MKNTCENCRHWRIKTDETGICDNPEWKVESAIGEVFALRLLSDLPESYTERQRVNLVRQLLQIRTMEDFGCNQFEKK